MEALLGILLRIRDDEAARDPGLGLMQTVGALARECQDWRVRDTAEALARHYALRWPKHSGDWYFPIPGGVDAFYNCPDKWDRSTEYGRLRWELLDFLIEELRNERN